MTLRELCPPLQLIDSIAFLHESEAKNPFVLHQKYAVEGLSLKQIAREYLSSPQTIRDRLIKAGVELRQHSQPHNRPSIPRYGKKIVKDRLVDHSSEQRVIEMIQGMKNEGLSLRAIARCLTQLKVTTKCQGVSWHPEMVKRALTPS